MGSGWPWLETRHKAAITAGFIKARLWGEPIHPSVQVVTLTTDSPAKERHMAQVMGLSPNLFSLLPE